jgi:hypothetical protein
MEIDLGGGKVPLLMTNIGLRCGATIAKTGLLTALGRATLRNAARGGLGIRR